MSFAVSIIQLRYGIRITVAIYRLPIPPILDPFFKSLPVSDEVPFEAGHAAPPPTQEETIQEETTRTAQPETTQKKRGRPRKQAVRAKQTTIDGTASALFCSPFFILLLPSHLPYYHLD